MTTLRWATLADADALFELATEFAVDAGGALGISRVQLRQSYCRGRDGPHPTLLAVEANRVVGFLALYRAGEGLLPGVKALFIEKDARRRGIARRLVLASEARHAFSGHAPVAFYHALGWAQHQTALGIVEQRPAARATPLLPAHSHSVELEDGAYTVELLTPHRFRGDLGRAIAALWDQFQPDYVTLLPGLGEGKRPCDLWAQVGARAFQVILNSAT